VVLRGSGAATTIKLSGKPHNAISIAAGKGDKTAEATGVKTTVADAYVPSGAMTFRVKDAVGFAAGDAIAVQKPVTEAWLKFMGMDDLVRDGKKETWLPPGRVLTTERRIASIAGNAITLDVPLSDSLDAKYCTAAVVKIHPARLEQCGWSSCTSRARRSRFRTRSRTSRPCGSTAATAGCAM